MTPKRSLHQKKKKSDDAVDLSIDVASFKTIIDVQKQDMNDLRMEKAQNTDPEHNLRKTEWTSFLSEAKKKSRKKKRSINSSKKRNKGRRMMKAREKYSTGLIYTTPVWIRKKTMRRTIPRLSLLGHGGGLNDITKMSLTCIY